MLKFKVTLYVTCLLCFSCSSGKQKSDLVAAEVSNKPNILLLIADDMGMADLGSFGSEIETPNLDMLALNGVRLSNFHASPACSPTRAMLLTGLDSHLVGLGNMSEELAPNQVGKPGYEGRINQVAPTIAERLKVQGYRTYLSGKWHLGNTPDSLPTARGFDKSFALMSGGASHYADMKPAYAPTPEIKAPYYENGMKLDQLPESFKYSSQYYADKMLEYIDRDKESNKPFFAMLSFTAPHWPLQAPADAIKKYENKYDEGYEILARNRLKRQKELGIVPVQANLNTLNEHAAPPWSELNAEQKRTSSRGMEIYAAMVDEMDAQVGKVISYLKENSLFDNTVIIFMSDNGAEGHTLDQTWPSDQFPKIRATIDAAHDFSYEAMGAPNSYVFYNAGWARAGAPAYRLHKGFPTEGGTRVPAFVYYSNIERSGDVETRQFNVKDILPTVLDFSGQKYTSSAEDNSLQLAGLSMLPYLRNPDQQLVHRVDVFELFGKIAVRDYPWKLVFLPQPWGADEWQLYNIEQDLLESQNLASMHPEVVGRLQQHWLKYKSDNNVILPDKVSGY